MSDEAGTQGNDSTEGDGQRLVTLGRVTGAHGIQGWVKVHSDTSPRDNILRYSPWWLLRQGQRETVTVKGGRQQGKTLVAKLAGCEDRDHAEALVGAEIAIPRERLPATEGPGEFYWADLVGLAVRTVDGVELGRIETLFETGANDVIVVVGERERLIPYLWQQVVRRVDIAGGVMEVDWDPDF